VNAKKKIKTAAGTTDPVKEFYSQLGKKSAVKRAEMLRSTANKKGDK